MDKTRITSVVWILAAALFAVCPLLLAGCTGIGPGTVNRDRFNYVNAISNSWKKQMLLNLIKIRYVDAPVFLEVSSIISQYAIEGQINLGAQWSNIDSQTLGGSGKFTDRPTVTYSPLAGEKFTRNLMTPIPVRAFLSMIQADYPADIMFKICIQTINGVGNRFGGKVSGRSADPNFYRLIKAMRRIQKSGGLGMRIKPMGDKKTIVLFFRKKISDDIAGDVNIVSQILGLSPDAREIRVVYGAFAADNREIAMLTRSVLQIMIELASYIDVPAKDVEEGRVAAFVDENAPDASQLIRIHSGASAPDEAFVTIQYRDNWFWIDDTDLASKRVFSFLMMLMSLTETGTKTGAPIVTVPTN
jgi:hypothetical protein